MYFLTYSKGKTEEELIRYLYPVCDESMRPVGIEYKLNGPYQLSFNTVRQDQENPCIIMQSLSPAGAVYSVIDRAGISDTMEKLILHRHDFYELMFVLSGEVFVNIENQRHLYTKGCCCILNRNVMHTEEYQTNASFVFLQLSSDLLTDLYREMTSDFFEPLAETGLPESELLEFMSNNLSNSGSAEKDYLDFVPFDSDGQEVRHIHDLFDRITMETLDPGRGASIRIKRYLIDLLCQLSESHAFSTTPVQIGSDAEYTIYSQIISVMEQNKGRVSRSQLSEQLNYSGAYLNEITKKYSGLSIFDFGMTFCMKEAARLLLKSSDNISDIGMVLGFSNRSHFYKVFKEIYHMTPAEYRRAKR